MSFSFPDWWRGRTARERWLMRAAAILVFAVLAPLSAFQAASQFRAEGAARLISARQTAADVAQIAAAPAAPSDGSLHGVVVSTAQAHGLTPARLETAGAGRVRVTFANARSLNVYRFMQAIGRAGATATRTAITRAGAGDQVDAELEIAAGAGS